LLTEEEQGQLVAEWNATESEFPSDKRIERLFEEQVRRAPEKIAVVQGARQCSYRELNQRANRLAHYLRGQGVGPEAPVGVCLGRSPEVIAALLGVLKAGGAYVPIDPAYPAERMRWMLEDAGVRLLLSDKKSQSELNFAGIPVVSVEEVLQAEGPEGNLAGEWGTDGLAYVMYTSGSSGRPKGVGVPHSGIARLLFGIDYVRLGPEEIILQMAPLGFDASTFEVWGALLHGGRLVLYPEEAPALEELEEVLRGEQVTCLWLTASLFNLVVDNRPEMLLEVGQLLAGGEALSKAHVDRALERLSKTELINGYGPTESTTFACCYRIPREIARGWEPVPIGRPICNTRVYVLDGSGQVCPVGVEGELYIGGEGVARGYLNRPGLTAERFVPDRFSGEGRRLYRSGDVVRWREEGWLEYQGRRDDQVKIRGFRIEPGEIESALRRQPGVGEAAVVVHSDGRGGKLLAGYIVAESGGVDTTLLRTQLKRELPEYMVPAALIAVAGLPLTANGKLDRKKLPAPQWEVRGEEREGGRAKTQTEELLGGIWMQVLGRSGEAGIGDHFFELGGHSLLCMQVISRVRELFGIDLAMRTLFEYPELEGLAARIDAELSSGSDVLLRDIASRFPELSPEKQKSLVELFEQARRGPAMPPITPRPL